MNEVERVYSAAEGGRSTTEIVRATGIPEDRVVEHLQALVGEGRIVGVPRTSPWYAYWTHAAVKTRTVQWTVMVRPEHPGDADGAAEALRSHLTRHSRPMALRLYADGTGILEAEERTAEEVFEAELVTAVDEQSRISGASDEEVLRLWRGVVARGRQLDGEADKGGHVWHSLWTGFVIGLGRADLTDWLVYMERGYPVEEEANREERRRRGEGGV